MFTDQPVTPMRLECLIGLLREHSRRTWTRADIAKVLQPRGLPDISATSDQANEIVKAGLELGLVVQDSGQIRLTPFDRDRTTHDLVLDAIDRRVLSSTEIEPYYASFYSYLTSLGCRGAERRDG